MSDKPKFSWMALPCALFAIGITVCVREIYDLNNLGSNETYAFRVLIGCMSGLMAFIIAPPIRALMLSMVAVSISAAFVASGSGTELSASISYANMAYVFLAACWILLGSMIIRKNNVFGTGYLFLVFVNAGAVVSTALMMTEMSQLVRLPLGIALLATSIATALFLRRRGKIPAETEVQA